MHQQRTIHALRSRFADLEVCYFQVVPKMSNQIVGLKGVKDDDDDDVADVFKL